LITNIIGGKKENSDSSESAHKFITQKSSWQSACLSNVHASAGAGVQPVATSDAFCTKLYFFVMNLTYFVNHQFDHWLFSSHHIEY
jgi:hypothetical protein